MGGGHPIYALVMPVAEEPKSGCLPAPPLPRLSASSLESVLEEGEVVFQFSDYKSPLIN